MVDRNISFLKPAGKRYTLPDGTLRTSSVNKPFAAIAKKMPDGKVKPLISMFPDMPYYGFLLVGAAEPVINSGFSSNGTNVVQQNEVWLDQSSSQSYPAHTDQQTSARQIYFDNGHVFNESFWLKSVPLIAYNYTAGQREAYMPSRAYAHVDQKMYCLRDEDSAGNPKILGYMQAFKRDDGNDFRYLSYRLQLQAEIKKSVFTHDYEGYPISYLNSASVQLTLWPYDADGNFTEHQNSVKPALTLSNYIDNDHSYDYRIVGPRYYREYWNHEGDDKSFFEYSKPIKSVAFTQSDSSQSNIAWTPIAILVGKLIEPARSCIYKQGDLIAAREFQGFCKLDHKVLYYKIPIKTGTWDSQLPTAPYNIVYNPGDIIVEEITDGSENYRSYKCIQADYNLEKFKSDSERPFYYIQIWQGLRDYDVSGLDDITEGHCPYGSLWNEYFDASTDEQIEDYVKLQYLQELE
ncbi:MAG: hypothetical protein ACIAQZ_12225 [Sedimentisphaeraceae bacterium JB056]